MNDSIDFMNAEGIKFFGSVNASISHELKNILAIISETAGFLNDLTDLAKQGKELKLSLLEGCSKSIAEDIQRGFATIKQMNKFAHSVDFPIKQIDIVELLNLIIGLSGFLSFASNVQIDKSDEKECFILTAPFLLQNLIYQILCSLYKSVGSNGYIKIQVYSELEFGVRLVFATNKNVSIEGFFTHQVEKTAQILGIEINKNFSSNEIEFQIPSASRSIVELEKKLKIKTEF